jgi:hypothetical protein
VVDVTRYVLPIEGLFPLGEWVGFSEHEGADDQGLDESKVPKHPERVTTASRGGRHQAMVSHLLDSREDDILAPLQILTNQVDGLHTNPARIGSDAFMMAVLTRSGIEEAMII